MARAVVDASVIVKWYFRERDSDLALDLLASGDLDLAAPDIAILETSHALLRREREKLFATPLADAALADLRAVLPAPFPSLPLVNRAVEIARALSHPLADCVYLALAEHLSCRMITADEAFVAHASRRGGDLKQHVGSLSELRHGAS